MTRYYRWGDNDRRVGPFIYAHSTRYRPLSLVLTSSDGEGSPCTLRVNILGHAFIALLPDVIKPARWWVDLSNQSWATSKGYWDIHPREYGVNYSDGHLNIAFGTQTHDSSTEQRWGCFLPWTQWRHVRHSYYDLNGEHFYTEQKETSWQARQGFEDACPTRMFTFKDYDGEVIECTTRIEEREWRFGEGWFKWLSWFRKPKVSRGLILQFSKETGHRKGSWKGGTIGHSIEMTPGELHESAFRRYCAEHEMTFMGEWQP